jgi:hypothetical protein
VLPPFGLKECTGETLLGGSEATGCWLAVGPFFHLFWVFFLKSNTTVLRTGVKNEATQPVTCRLGITQVSIHDVLEENQAGSGTLGERAVPRDAETVPGGSPKCGVAAIHAAPVTMTRPAAAASPTPNANLGSRRGQTGPGKGFETMGEKNESVSFDTLPSSTRDHFPS